MFEKTVGSIIESLSDMIKRLDVVAIREFRKHGEAVAEATRAFDEGSRAEKIKQKLEQLIN